jgi:hypothetical protein
LKEAPYIDKIIKKKVVHCTNQGVGCSWSGKVESYENHLMKCSFNLRSDNATISNYSVDLSEEEKDKSKQLMDCIYDGCPEKILELKNHLEEFRDQHEIILLEKFYTFQNEIKEKFDRLESFIMQKRKKNTDILSRENIVNNNLTHNLGKKQEKINEIYNKTLDFSEEIFNYDLTTHEKEPFKSTKMSLKSPIKRPEKKPSKTPASSKSVNFDEQVYLISPTRNQAKQTIEKKFQINNKEHSSNIIIIGKRVKVDKNVEEKYRFAFADAKLNYSSWKWKVKIIKMKEWIALGACFKDEIIAGNYKYTKYLNHSTFVVTSNGFIWNCLNQNENGDRIDFLELDEGDIVEFSYDIILNKLICYFKHHVVTLTKVKAGLINFLVPCVIFQNEGDEVEFIECS